MNYEASARKFFDELKARNDADQFEYDVYHNKRRARERVRDAKANERVAKFYIFCVSIPAWILSGLACYVIWRLFL